MRNNAFKQLLLRITYYTVPVLVFLAIWIPVFYHYHVPDVVIRDEVVQVSRRVPTGAVFNEINSFSFGFNHSWLDDSQLVVLAEKILHGEVQITGRPSIAIGIPFDADDLNRSIPGWPDWRLFFASFAIPDLLLRAYQVTGRDDFLMTARDIILGWASYERSAWLPKGLLWNDHAIAARISVLAKFWKLYRNHPDFEPQVAKDILLFVARSAQLLAKPTHFTFSTNHGIMQNLALWQICLAFPTLPNIEFYKQLALERMRDQMVFYINDEGVVLEHSAGYQRIGLEFIGMAFRYLTLLDVPIFEEWRVKYKRAKDFYAQLRRPDGSLPMCGDTHSVSDSPGPFVTEVDSNGRSEKPRYQKKWAPKQSNSLYPVGGYSIWWDGLGNWPDEEKLAQTVVAWSYFPGHGHKHADEMSVLFWAGGKRWLTNVGYWPYGTKGRSEAVSWDGSNAPHLVGESTTSKRNTKLKFHGRSENLVAIDLERTVPQEYVARRQVVHVKPNLWVVVDHTFGNNDDRTTTIWTTSHDVQINEGKIPGYYNFELQNNGISLSLFIFGGLDPHIRRVRGSWSPFAGWEDNKPADAIFIEQPADNAWVVTMWSLDHAFSPSLRVSGQPYMHEWKDSEDWKIAIPVESGMMSISRKKDRVWVNENAGDGMSNEVILIKPVEQGHAYTNIQAGYKAAARKYPRSSYNLHRRLKVTYLLMVIFLLQEIFFLIYRKLIRVYYVQLRVLSVLCWAGIGVLIWIDVLYFKTLL